MGADVPAALWLIESYLNSVNVEDGADDLDSLPRFRRWLGDHGRASVARVATEADLALARQLRDELRAVLHAHCEGRAGGSSRLNELAAHVPLRVRFGGNGGPDRGPADSPAEGPVAHEVTLVPAEGGVLGLLGEVLAAVATGERDGTWRRLKLCRQDTCQVVFFDRSKNASRCWCSMQVCGNRNKTRAYRRRASTG